MIEQIPPLDGETGARVRSAHVKTYREIIAEGPANRQITLPK
jgi:hypothetical protein